MSSGAWYSVRYFEEDIKAGLFDDWRSLAWRQMYQWADISTGAVQVTVREMALCWNTSIGSVDRWLTALAKTERNIRLERIGPTSREGRRIIVLDIEERAAKRTRNNGRNEAGTMRGITRGTTKTSNGAAETGNGGTKSGTNGETKPEHEVGHVYKSTKYDVGVTVPTEPCEGGAGDLFGEQAAERCPPAPAEPEPENPSAVAQRVLAVFHELSKSIGGKGVSPENWAGQQKITQNALKTVQSEQAAAEAIRWGMKDDYWRQRLRARGMTVLADVWAAWDDETRGTTNGRNGNGNGRNGAGHAGGEVGAGQAAGGGQAYLNNGRWERR